MSESIKTAQEMFNKVVAHLRQQGRKAMLGKHCCYRGEDNTKCAVGCLIPDDEYKISMEMMGAVLLLHNFPTLSKYIPDVNLACELQLTHDTVEPKDWEASLSWIAQRYGLTLPPQSSKMV